MIAEHIVPHCFTTHLISHKMNSWDESDPKKEVAVQCQLTLWKLSDREPYSVAPSKAFSYHVGFYTVKRKAREEGKKRKKCSREVGIVDEDKWKWEEKCERRSGEKTIRPDLDIPLPQVCKDMFNVHFIITGSTCSGMDIDIPPISSYQQQHLPIYFVCAEQLCCADPRKKYNCFTHVVFTSVHINLEY